MLDLVVLPGLLAVCRLPAGCPPPPWRVGDTLTSVTHSADETSIVCDASAVPPGVTVESGWCAIKVAGPLDLGLTGVLLSVAQPLADAGVSIFALSTYDTDYVLVKESALAKAVATLSSAGHRIGQAPSGARVQQDPAEMWAAYKGSDAPGSATADAYTAWHFGSGAEMADELVDLVLAGHKRATAGALWSYELEGDPIPQVGEYSVITDGSGAARCIIRTTAIEIVPFSEVGAEFAAAEGEGDLSLEYWREGHWRFFTAELAAFGREPEPDMPVVCERFEVVYPEGDGEGNPR